MTISAQSILRRVTEALTDKSSVQWRIGELARYFNDGQRAILVHRPDATSTQLSLALVSGSKQSLPSNAVSLLNIMRNTGGNMRSIRMVSDEDLSAQLPNWRSVTPSTEVIHFLYDQRDPLTFHVYPPAVAATTSVDLLYSANPVDITEPADGLTYTSVTGNLGMMDIYANSLHEYILFRAYDKNSGLAGAAEKSAKHYGAFLEALGSQLQSSVSAAQTANPA